MASDDDKKMYPPTFVTPGQTTRLTAKDGIIEFIGVYDDKVLDFLVAFAKCQELAENPIQVSTASMEAAARARDRAWKQLDAYTLKTVMERIERGQIWTPEGGSDGG